MAVVVLVLAALGPARAAEDSSEPLRIKIGPYQQHVTRDSITIMWETNRPASSVVEYGTAAPPTLRCESAGEAKMHEVTITGLLAELVFFYRVISEAGGERVESEVYPFKTAAVEGTPFAFAVVGDNRSNPENWGRIADLCYAERPNFVINVGDLCADGNVYEEWIEQWLAPAATLMARVPMYASIGNHERNADWYYYYVSYPQPENYYSFDYGNAHFVAVDTNQDVSPDSPQYRWLEKDLRRADERWKFVFHHHPLYSSDLNDYGDTTKEQSTLGHLNLRHLARLYENYGVDVVFVGHIHSYERTWPMRGGKVNHNGGVIYLQAGGGGAPLEDFAPERSYFTAKVASNHHYCIVAISGNTLRMMAYDIDGRMFDYLDVNKR
ncbi:MAG: metallophosphoesterase family protein [Armatimonadota bacterium]|nr:MAG: metallophosphoesterase family protein [Armatimonadota bacterium]